MIECTQGDRGGIEMKVAIFEVCRNPEIEKQTETLMLSEFCKRSGIECEVYSNDGIWTKRTFLNRSLFQNCLSDTDTKVVHLALHGDRDGLVMRWSNAEKIRDRRPQERLSPQDIESIVQWRDKVVVSGAYSAAKLSDAFLKAGVAAAVFPEHPISYQHLVPFLEIFYGKLATGLSVRNALNAGLSKFPDLKSFKIFSRRSPDTLVVA
ncbi:hypothetical protein [Baaleninema simplex]|uniref:hypothetical protein n=1 Tax=Baaleninema simplex TaxID=2862350 RepID=UPI0003457DD4|nr:hypothetical protein [Baaleninema simplex]